MKIIVHVFLVLLFLCCTSCVTSLVLKGATKGTPKQDKVEFVRAFENDKNLVFHLNGSLAEGENAEYTINLGKEWATDTSSDWFFVKRSKISEGYYFPAADWIEIKVFKRFDNNFKSDYVGQGCYLVQECDHGVCQHKLYYECFDMTKSVYTQRKVFYLESELGFPPVYKFLLVPLTLSMDVITFPFQFMLLSGLKNVN
ncbi:MAG: hypothetical protein HXX11_08245 [Desulfuromonadales bacterium]|nr:hypothetical protein [Desulfuromonadales bacterium]